jgi:hypothetical protein
MFIEALLAHFVSSKNPKNTLNHFWIKPGDRKYLEVHPLKLIFQLYTMFCFKKKKSMIFP